MILVDANLLLHAYNAGSSEHDTARKWWEGRLNSSELVGLPWSVVLAFLRITTHASVFSRPLTIKESCSHVDEWLERPQVRLLSPGRTYWKYLRATLEGAQVRGNLVMDAALAALAQENGVEIMTTDRDFNRFEVRHSNPLNY